MHSFLICSRSLDLGADLLVHVQVGGVRDDLGGDRHAPGPQVHLLGLLPVVQTSRAHPDGSETPSLSWRTSVLTLTKTVAAR